jgi:predicted KAP-like P-loop ATPase
MPTLDPFRVTRVRCPECARVLIVGVRRTDNRFILPEHQHRGAPCAASTRLMQTVSRPRTVSVSREEDR